MKILRRLQLLCLYSLNRYCPSQYEIQLLLGMPEYELSDYLRTVCVNYLDNSLEDCAIDYEVTCERIRQLLCKARRVILVHVL